MPSGHCPRAYLLSPDGLKDVVVVLLLAASACAADCRGAPILLPANEASHQVAAADYFAWNHLAFYSNKLYAVSMVGLLEIEDGSISGLYSWGKDSVLLMGVWLDKANGLLWVSLSDREMWQYDGHRWCSLRFPKPKHGYISRQDVWRGFRAVSNAKTFWVEGAGRMWAWKGAQPGKWIEEALPRGFGSGTTPAPLLKRLIATEEWPYLIKRDEREPMDVMASVAKLTGEYNTVNGDTVFGLARGKWTVISNTAGRFFSAETAAVNRRGYIRTTSGDVLDVTPERVSKLEVPGVCEGIVASEGTMIASFRGLGIYELGDGWHRLLPSPYPKDGEPHEVILAAQKGHIALAIRPSGMTKADFQLHSQLWISSGKSWSEVLKGVKPKVNGNQ